MRLANKIQEYLSSAKNWPNHGVLCGLVSFFSIVNLPVMAQFLPNHVPLMQSYPYFDHTFMVAHGVEEIATEVMYKWPMQKLVFASEKEQFVFGTTGHVEKRMSTNKSGNVVSYFYYLSSKGHLASEQKHTTKSDEMKLFTYNDKGLVTAILVTNAKTGVELDKQVFNYEYFTDYQYKKYWLNSEGLTYKYATINLDEKQRITEERIRFVRGAMRETTYYSYENNRLISYSHNIKEASRRETKYVIKYNESRQVIEVEEFKDGALINHFEYLYENEMLTAILKKSIKSHQITITKFQYKYFIK